MKDGGKREQVYYKLKQKICPLVLREQKVSEDIRHHFNLYYPDDLVAEDKINEGGHCQNGRIYLSIF